MLSDIMSHSFYHCRRLVTMRRMTAVFQFKYFDSGNHSRDAVDLLHCPVLILLALNREHRTCASWHVLVNRPRGPALSADAARKGRSLEKGDCARAHQKGAAIGLAGLFHARIGWDSRIVMQIAVRSRPCRSKPGNRARSVTLA